MIIWNRMDCHKCKISCTHISTIRYIFCNFIRFSTIWRLIFCNTGSYDTIKNNICKRYLGLEEGFLLHFVSSMISGVLTATAANPFDTIKSRYMSDNTNTYSSVVDCAMKSYRKDGARVFLQGWLVVAYCFPPITPSSLRF